MTGARRRLSRLLGAVVLAGLAARAVRYFAGFPIFGDEAFVAVNLLERDLRGLVGPLEHGVVAPIGYLAAALGSSRLLGGGELALRLPAFLAGLATLLLFARWAPRAVGRTAGACAVALLAASYYPIRHGAEVKPYATDLLLALPLYAGGLALVREPGRRGVWLAFAAFAAAAVWCSFTAAFVAGGVLLATGAFAWRDARRAKGTATGTVSRSAAAWLIAAAAVTASFAAMYLLVGRHQQWDEAAIEDARHWQEHFPPLSRPWLLPWWLVREHTGNMFAYPNGGRDFGCIGTTLLVAAGGVALWRKGSARVALLLLSPLVPMLAAAALRKYPYGGSARTTLHLAVPVCLLAGAGFVAVVGGWRRRAGRRSGGFGSGTVPPRARGVVRAAEVFCGAMVVLAVGTIVSDVGWPRKGEADVRTKAAVHELRARTQPADRWIVFGTFQSVPHAPDLSSWRGSAARLRYQLLLGARELGVPLEWAPPSDALEPAGAGSTWVLVYRDNEAPFPEPLWTAWLRDATARLGAAADARAHVFGPASPDPATGAGRTESLTVLRFEPRRE